MDTSEIDVNQWKEVNKCETDAAFNSDKTDIICVCPDKSTCREKNGVKVGCPCKEITQQPDSDSDSDFLGIPIWGWVLIGLGIILLIISIGYLLKKYYNKKPTVKPVAVKPPSVWVRGINGWKEVPK
jgi:hypothetical protein